MEIPLAPECRPFYSLQLSPSESTTAKRGKHWHLSGTENFCGSGRRSTDIICLETMWGWSPDRQNRQLNPVADVSRHYPGGGPWCHHELKTRGGLMLARVVEVNIKGGKKQEVETILQNELLPLLQKQPGFAGYETLLRETDPNVTLSISYWQNREQADTFVDTAAYNAIRNKLQPLLANDIRPVFYTVEISTQHRIAFGKAA
jgi:quinol monooxygenase YgiN